MAAFFSFVMSLAFYALAVFMGCVAWHQKTAIGEPNIMGVGCVVIFVIGFLFTCFTLNFLTPDSGEDQPE